MSRKNTGPGKPSSEPTGMSPTVRALPGSVQSEASRPEWIDVTVMPRDGSAPKGRAPRPKPVAQPRSRADVYAQGVQESTAFRDSLMRWLDEHHLLGAVRAVSEPGSMPMLTLRCAPRVLDQLRRAPEFEAGATMSVEFYSC